jgi:glycosyltransferase involved in cell wall biosynthesis
MVNPENVFEIAKGIREALTNGPLRAALIQKGQQQARRFSWEATARAVLEIYREVAGEAGSGLQNHT